MGSRDYRNEKRRQGSLRVKIIGIECPECKTSFTGKEAPNKKYHCEYCGNDFRYRPKKGGARRVLYRILRKVRP